VPFVCAVSPREIALHPIPPDTGVPILFTPDQLRWFGRPKKYHYGTNEMWLHVEQRGQWHLIRLRLARETMMDLVRALKQVAAPELVTAYRRQRPYIHQGPLVAHPATQDVLGAWSLGDPVSLYLMPRALVLLAGAQVQRVLPLEQIQQISAIRRLDQPGAEGLVRFEIAGEPFAYALPGHDTFAAALAEAAKRTLEDPVLWQRKKKKGDVLLDEDEIE
jgi:hypothetical protein